MKDPNILKHLGQRLLITGVALLLFSATAAAQWTWTPQTGRWINLKQLPKETPELQMEYARGLLIEKDYKKAWRETGKFVQFYGDSDYADENQFLRGEIRQAQGKYMEAAKQYQQVLANYPSTELYDDAIERQYEIGDTYYEEGLKRVDSKWRLFRKRPLKRAVEVYSMVIDNGPFSPAAAEAQYKVGLCQYTRKEYLEAAFEYRRVVEDYSGSEWVDEASYGLAMCYHKMSLAPEYDQEPSQLTIDSINNHTARYPDDARNAELQTISTEMYNNIAEQRLLTAKFYERRRKFPSAKIYYEVVASQYPDAPAAEQAKAWLASHEQVEHIGQRRARFSGEE
ncbi:MAG: outer membrane protein assembly factor BamD [Candidatus Hydrogenedentes bacterium]|nr:outer membrane protein assembly factor BamD [Candidatus Hydrogenedentota bacterium]